MTQAPRQKKERAPPKLPLIVRFYFDYKSPFSYLVKVAALYIWALNEFLKDQVYELERDYKDKVKVVWLPFAFSVEHSFGLPEKRNEFQWRKVRYGYKDARRWANERGLILYGPQRVFDSTIALIGGIFAQRHDQRTSTSTSSSFSTSAFEFRSSSSSPCFKLYTDKVFSLFFQRKLVLDDAEEISRILLECGVDVKDFKDFLKNEGPQRIEEIRKMADKDELFGVPSFVVEGELFFGNDRIDWVRKELNSLLGKPSLSSL